MVELARDLDLEPEVVVVEMDTWRNHQLTGNRKYDNNQPQQVFTRNKNSRNNNKGKRTEAKHELKADNKCRHA